MRVLKNGTASTLDVVNNLKAALPDIRAAAPEGMAIKPLFDQSVFVSAAIEGVLHEAAIAAALTGLTILLFLGSWRSTLIVLVSIPLCIMTSLAILAALGQTINVMTLGGLALAVGILVDDATVAIENTYRLFEEGRPFRNSVVEGAAGIAKPALISTLSICAAFVSVFALTDTPKYLFTPQALAVVFAMLTSYLLSRTLVPVMIDVLVEREYLQHHGRDDAAPRSGRIVRAATWLTRPVFWLAGGFPPPVRGVVCGLPPRLCRAAARGAAPPLRDADAGRPAVCRTGVLFVRTGQDYFPQVEIEPDDASPAHRPGMRIETAEQVFAEVQKVVREVIPERDRADPRQHRPAVEQLQLRLLRRLVRFLQRRADADRPEGGHGPSRTTCVACGKCCTNASPT